MPDRKTRELLAKYAIGAVDPPEIIGWACEKMEQGGDSTHLRLLAGYVPAEAERELDEFRRTFAETLRELELEVPAEKDAYSDYACSICEAIVDGSMRPATALRILYEIWVATNYHPDKRIDARFESWMYLDDSISLAAEGHAALLERFSGVNAGNFGEYVKQEAQRFLRSYGDHRAEQAGGARPE